MKKYDYLIVGAGLTGAAFARRMEDRGKKCLVIDKRNHIAGNRYTYSLAGITVHRYGAHIFHTNSEKVWQFAGRFARFNRFTNSPLANYKGEIYNLPFNMNTFKQMWGVSSPRQAKAVIDRQRRRVGITVPENLEQQAISLVGRDIYEKLVKGYTEKQWGRPCRQLPAFIIRRLPVRFVYDNNYFDALYQGIPEGGYTKMVAGMLAGADVMLGCDYLKDRRRWNSLAQQVVYTGPIDAYFGFCLGVLEYRSLKFVTRLLDTDNYQGNAVINYTDRDTPYTRVIEHKHFEFSKQERTVVTREYPQKWHPGRRPFYPVNDEKNNRLYEKYRRLAEKEKNVIFAGRLAQYRYYDMDRAIENVLDIAERR